jgi:Secretion system C-terminal sorting domain
MKHIYFVLILIFFAGFSATAQYSLPTENSTLFSGSGNCADCHTGNGDVLSLNGVDISPTTYWRSTMMANSSKDPLWRAMVSGEVYNFPSLQDTIETMCTKCHAPMGYTEALYDGQTTYTIEQLRQDPLANDGVSCTVCHQINPSNFGEQSSYSGGYIINADSLIYGPYQYPDSFFMYQFIGYEPVYEPKSMNSELCATCHTLFTPTLDESGNVVGNFPEQTPYLEWKNSIYPLQQITCQSCHSPKIFDPIDIATVPEFDTTHRSPFWEETFVGGNTFILKMLRDYPDTLQVTATTEHFDSTLLFAENNLKHLAVNLHLDGYKENDSLTINVKLQNLTGHKLPTGIPLRRMWIHLKVLTPDSNLIFESGKWDIDGKISGMNLPYEKHHNVINSGDDIQIYESVPIDYNGNVTLTLLKASTFIKDNRIPPIGFVTSHNSYDTTAYFGDVLNDPNFNKDGNIEGTGTDITTYRIPLTSDSEYLVFAEVCYQTLKPEVAEYLAGMNSLDIDRFNWMYDAADKTPVIMKSDELDIQITNNISGNHFAAEFKLNQNYPNPFNPSTTIRFSIPEENKTSLIVYDILGKEIAMLINGELNPGEYDVQFDGTKLPSGIYFYQLISGTNSQIHKMVLIK